MSNEYLLRAEPEKLPEIINWAEQLTPFLIDVMTGRDNPTEETSTEEALLVIKVYLDMLDVIVKMQRDFEHFREQST